MYPKKDLNFEEPISIALSLLGDLPKHAWRSLEQIFKGNHVKSNNPRLTAAESLIQFFREKILSKEAQKHLQKSKEGFLCFQHFFLAANGHLKHILRPDSIESFAVRVFPEELEGFNELWTYILLCENQDASEEAIRLLIKIYSGLADRIKFDSGVSARFIDRCFQNLNRDTCLKCLKLISLLMGAFQRNEIENILTHSILGKYAPIYVKSEDSNGKNIVTHSMLGKCEPICTKIKFENTTLKLTMHSNSSLFDLVLKIAASLKICWDGFSLFHAESNSEDLRTTHSMSSTLSELGLGVTGSEQFIVHMRKLPSKELLSNDALNPLIEKIFTTIFEQYSDNDMMSPKQLATFGSTLKVGRFSSTDARIIDIFSKYDSDKDGFLSLQDFLNFYLQSAKIRPETVWKNLEALSIRRYNLIYGEDLTCLNNHKIYCYVNNTISSNQTYLDSLFSLLGSEEESLAFEAWKLLNRLPTKQKLFEDLIRLKGVRDITDPKARDWNSIIDVTSKYKLLYVLNMIEYLMYFNQQDNPKIMALEDPELIKYQEAWRIDFIEYGGLNHLCNVFSLFKPRKSTVFTKSYKRVFAFAKVMNEGLSQQGLKTDNMASFMSLSSAYQDEYTNISRLP